MTYIELEQNVIAHFNSDKYNCAESVLKALLEYFEIPFTEDAINVFAGFGGGVGGSGALCGTITGAVAFLGYKYKNAETKDKKPISRGLANKIYKKFIENYKDSNCHTITKDVPRKDKKAKIAFCTPINADVVVFTAKIVEEFDATGVL